jgi:hypothetical protein
MFGIAKLFLKQVCQLHESYDSLRTVASPDYCLNTTCLIEQENLKKRIFKVKIDFPISYNCSHPTNTHQRQQKAERRGTRSAAF